MTDLTLSDIEKIISSNRELIEVVTTEHNNWDLGILVHGPEDNSMYLLFYLRSRLDSSVIIYASQLVKSYQNKKLNEINEQALRINEIVFHKPVQTLIDKFRILSDEFSPALKLLEKERVTDLAALRISYEEFNELRLQADKLQLSGFEIKIQKSIQKILPESNSTSIILSPLENNSKLSVFQYDLLAMINDQPYSIDEIDKLISQMDSLIKLSTGYIELSSLKNLKKIIDKLTGELTSLDNNQKLAISQGNQLVLRKNIRDLLNKYNIGIEPAFEFRYDQILEIENIDILDSLKNIDLIPFQVEGIKWLLSIAMRKMGGILADDMGMGKTIQTMAMISYLVSKNEIDRPVLVVTPQYQSLLQWKDEFTSRTDLSVEISYGTPSRVRKSKLRELNARNDIHVVLTTIQTLKKDVNILKEVEWSGIIIDEAQIIKSPDSVSSMKFRSLAKNVTRNRPIFRIALTGTPIENSLIDLWTIFDFIIPKYLPGISAFKEQFGTRYKDLAKKPNRFVDLDRLVYPFIIKRNKEDFLDLPAKNELKVYCTLSKSQIAMYTATVNSLKDNLYAFRDHKDPKSIITRSSHIFSTIIKLKQICDHPFSQKELFNYKSVNIADSNKILSLVSILKKIRDKNEKVLIYTQYINVGKIIQKAITETFGYKASFYNGKMSPSEREIVRKSFQSDKSRWVLILSLKSGGVGLNLQAASHVIHFDRWYNPAVENQATDRAYRFGQEKEVFVHKMITRGTIEERIDEILEDKLQLSGILNTRFREGQISQLNDEELMRILNYNY